MNTNERFTYTCPKCQAEINAACVAAALPDEILRAETARRNGRCQTPHPGPGRPAIARCPGCDAAMSSAELREHRADCVRDRLRNLRNFKIHLQPKDPDPYPDFMISELGENEVTFQKLSSGQWIDVELQKVAEITPSLQERLARIRLHGRVTWHENIHCWRFTPSVLGRPMLKGTPLV